MKKIILDTNFLLIPYQFKVDIFTEIRRICDFKYQLSIIDQTKDELKKIVREQKGKNKLAAILALMLLDQQKVKQLKTKEKKLVDDIILEKADKDWVVATQDAMLKRKLKKKGIALIVLRQKKHLVLQET